MSVLDDLVTVCADAADPTMRQQADALLGQGELTARLAALPDKYDVSRFDIDAVSGGVWRAGVFAACLGPLGPIPNFAVLGGVRACGVNANADQRAYGAALSVITPQATELVTAASAAGGAGWLTASRRRVWAGADAGASYQLDPFPGQPLTPGTDGAFRFVGSFRVQFTGQVWSRGTSSPLAITVALAGTTFTATRSDPPAPAPALTAAQRIGLPVAFDVEVAVTFASPTVVALVNNTAFECDALGVVRVIPA
jgi:hypothetical protein